MATRVPWLELRKALIGLALLDSGVLVTVYNLLFWQQIGRWPGISGAVGALVVIWTTFSYLLGRYSNGKENKSIASLAIVALIVTTLTVGAVWLGVKGDARTLPQFLLPLLVVSGAISTVLAKSINRNTRQRDRWLLIASKAEQRIVDEEVRRGSSDHLLIVSCSEDAEIQEKLKTCNQEVGIAISEEIKLDDKTIEQLLTRRSKGQQVMKLTDWFESRFQLMPPELLSREWIVMADGFRLQPDQFSWRLKRLGDISFALFLLLITSPLALVAAILIKLEDGGPILYSQIRTGQYEQQFRIWKLRSMRPNSEQDSAQWATKNDPRITRVGQVLRKLRIDELPQLINVLKGEMSLIGPRPERPELERQLEATIDHYRVRHWIRPGLSGWAQVSYNYGASVEDSRIKLGYDLYYLRNFSAWLDLLVLLKTIRLISNGKGASPSDKARKQICLHSKSKSGQRTSIKG
jgi:exopolysaccharide biosynthesis polyprenyl glycosylphosphotransferase